MVVVFVCISYSISLVIRYVYFIYGAKQLASIWQITIMCYSMGHKNGGYHERTCDIVPHEVCTQFWTIIITYM